MKVEHLTIKDLWGLSPSLRKKGSWAAKGFNLALETFFGYVAAGVLLP
jgi:hypothetical protein